MKKLILLLLFFRTATVFAQSSTPSINDLFISNAPGLILADKSTMTVQRPTTPRAFALSLVNLGQGGAVETSPYWWSGGANLSFEDYTNMKWPILQTLDISVANYKTTDGVFNLAPGIRSQIFRTHDAAAMKAMMAKYKEWQDYIVSPNVNLVHADSLKKQYDMLTTKGIISVDLAAAILGTSTSNPLTGLDFNKSGIWTNVSWNPSGFPFGFVGLAKYAWSKSGPVASPVTSKYLDFGGQANYATDKLALAAEYVNRRDFSAGQNYSKLTASLTYAVTDDIQLVGSYGKDLSPGEGLIALFGINFGLHRK